MRTRLRALLGRASLPVEMLAERHHQLLICMRSHQLGNSQEEMVMRATVLARIFERREGLS
jgi:hypothetical protein